MRQVDGNVRHVLAHDVDDHVATIGRNVVVAIEHDGRREDRQMLGALGQQTVKQLIVEDGAVKGVEVDGERLTSHAVLLACGGIANGPREMIFPRSRFAFPYLPFPFYSLRFALKKS